MTKEKKTRVIVLGGGISGLALAWYLSKQNVDRLL
ncbi:MAG: NAD(P)-binding protein [Chlamydiales bacterium]